MKKQPATIGLVLLLMAVSVFTLFASPVDTIVVTGADIARTSSLTNSTTLESFLTAVSNRITLQYADFMRQINLSTPPTQLTNYLSTVPDRIVIQYGNEIRHIPLSNIPSALSTYLSEVSPRIVFQYANSNRELQLTYPKSLMADTSPPSLLAPPTISTTSESATISWSTNEFTTYELRYGTSPGNHSYTTTNSSFQENHSTTIIGLSIGVTYYFQIISTDLSDNQSTSSEYNFTTESYVYLPMITK